MFDIFLGHELKAAPFRIGNGDNLNALDNIPIILVIAVQRIYIFRRQDVLCPHCGKYLAAINQTNPTFVFVLLFVV